MIRLKISYDTNEERYRLIQGLGENFDIINISKEYKKEGPHKKIYMDLSNKK